MKLALFLSLLQLVVGIDSSHVQVAESGVVDVCSQTILTQLTMLGLLEEVGEEVKQTHTDTTLKHDNILTQVTQGDTNILSRVSQGHTDIISHLTQGHSDVIQYIMSILTRWEQSEVTLLEAVKQLSTDVTNRLEQKEDSLESCKTELGQTRTLLNQTQVLLTQTQTYQIMMQTDLENTKVTLEQKLNDSVALATELTKTRTELEQQTNLTAEIEQQHAQAQTVLQQELSETRTRLQQQTNLTAEMEQQHAQAQTVLKQELSETRAALEALQAKVNQSAEAAVGCKTPFTEVEAVGCIYLSPNGSEKQWEAARLFCLANGANLYIGKGGVNLGALADHINNVYGYKDWHVWVGIKARHWLDGRLVTSDEWHSSQPNGDPEECGRIDTGNDYRRIYDTACSNKQRYICLLD